MAQMIELDLRPDRRKLRQFGFIACGAFALLATCAYFETWMFSFGLGAARTAVTGGLAGVAAYALLAALLYPGANRVLYVGLTVLAFPIGFVLSYVILGVLFFAVIAPIGLAIRISGRDPMQRRSDPSAASYWTGTRPTRPKESYFRQF